MRFSGKLMNANGLIGPNIEFGFEDINSVYVSDDVIYIRDTPIALSSVVVTEDIDDIVKSIYWRDENASWGVTPWGDKLVLYLTVLGITRAASGASMEEALSNAWKYFNVI